MSTARARLTALVEGATPPGVYRWTSRAHPAAMRRELAALGWACHLLDGRTVTDRERLFDACADSLALPAWFGRNFDALADCLRDLSWLPGSGHVVLWQHYGSLADHDPASWVTTRAVFDGSAADRMGSGLPPLYLLLRGHGPTEGLTAL